MITFVAKIKSDGGLDFGSSHNLRRFRQWCKEHPGKELRIQEMKRVRSLNQNRLYWFYLEVIERETGNRAEYLHELFKQDLLPPQWISVLGKEIRIAKSTTELTKLEFVDYMEKISALTEVPIPNTEDYHRYVDTAPLQE